MRSASSICTPASVSGFSGFSASCASISFENSRKVGYTCTSWSAQRDSSTSQSTDANGTERLVEAWSRRVCSVSHDVCTGEEKTVKSKPFSWSNWVSFDSEISLCTFARTSDGAVIVTAAIKKEMDARIVGRAEGENIKISKKKAYN